MRLNHRNREAYHNIQDWTHKIEGQSKEFIPKVSASVEQFTAFAKKGLTQFGDWFSVDSKGPISGDTIREVLKCFLAKLPDGPTTIDFATRLTDALKIGLTESLMIFKVHGFKVGKKMFKAEEGNLRVIEMKPWKLQIDIVAPEDYYPDPTGRGLYEIHEVERDLFDLHSMTEEHGGPYIKSVVDQITTDYTKALDERRNDPAKKDQNTQTPKNRKRVVLREFWGTLLKPDGSIWMKDVLCTIANDKYLIRKPEPMPYWHGESCFVTAPIMRVPFSVWHRAVYDQVVPLNFALNEMFNLMLDGGIASVWGIKQLRSEYLEDPRQVSGGIPQGKTLVVKADMPEGVKVLENVTEGQVPPDAMAMYQLLEREANSASFTNEIKLGGMPSKQVKATEIVAAEQSSAALMDTTINDIEGAVTRLLSKAWMTILQNLDDVLANDLVNVVPPRDLLLLARLKPAERFAQLAAYASFKVFGLSATLAKARDFSKIMALLQVAQQNPLLMPVMLERMSGNKLWDYLLKVLNINPQNFQPDEQEKAQLPGRMAMFQQAMGGQTGENKISEPTGEPGLQSEVSQNTMMPGNE